MSCIATHIGRCWIGDKGALMIWMGRCSLVVSVTWSAVYSKVNILGVLTSGYIINAIVSSLSLFIASYLKSMMLGRKLQSKLIRCIVWNLKNVANSLLFSTAVCMSVWERLCVRHLLCGRHCVWGSGSLEVAVLVGPWSLFRPSGPRAWPCPLAGGHLPLKQCIVIRPFLFLQHPFNVIPEIWSH